ncbi:MAG TPA: M20/M25/M40 family metallo-hydrolase [Terriglobales bacterium]|nr:M20/M25/M40 family metallo-hydrolase [Terriglobales bacterium]
MKRLLICTLLFLSAAALAQMPGERVIEEALKPSPLGENLRKLTDEVGGRVPGTPAFDGAIAWAREAFKAAGADSVTTEEFTMPQGWEEGATSLDVTAPTRFHARAISIAWSSPLAKTRARVVDIGRGTPGDFAKAGDVSGTVVLVHSGVLKTWEDLFAEYLEAPAIIDQAAKAKAAAIAFTATREHDILYRHINTFSGKVFGIPQVLIAREDAERIARLLAAGKQVEVDLSLPNRVLPPIHTSNVIAELRGSERPNEFVILGAHLDSWNLGTGALDNGCNAALVVDALRAIKASGVKPRRSIRFVLFSGEEQGTFGSWDYAKRHRAELDNMAGVVIFDTGIGEVTGFSVGGRKDIATELARAMRPLERFGATQLTADAFVGTDNYDFLIEGVPNFVANQKEDNYLVNYHATSDTFDKVDLERLKRHVAIAAYLTTALAHSREKFSRQSRPEIEQLMRETHLDDQMKALRLWDEWENGSRGRQK